MFLFKGEAINQGSGGKGRIDAVYADMNSIYAYIWE